MALGARGLILEMPASRALASTTLRDDALRERTELAAAGWSADHRGVQKSPQTFRGAATKIGVECVAAGVVVGTRLDRTWALHG